MSELDNKLREILTDIAELPDDFITDKDIAQIKQAFTDAGWRDGRSNNQAATYGGYLSGQEWYDKFEKELDKLGAQNVRSLNGRIIKAIAKKATGLG